MKANLLKEYIWLLDAISKTNGITFKELNGKWERSELSEGAHLSRATFNRHRDDIFDTFGIEIECDRQSNRYRIANPERLKEQTVQNWMISTLTVNNIISESLSLQDRILLESVPSAGDFLTKVIEAMKQGVRVRVTYHKYGEETSRPLVVDPYCIKLSSQRWYMLAHRRKQIEEKQETKDLYFLYSFDRIETLEQTDEHFEMDPEFDPEAFFKEFFGVMTIDEVPLARIRLRVYGKERYYMKDLPLHITQRVVAEEEEHTDFEMTLRPTIDFIHQLLAKGNRVKVLEPASLVERIREELRLAMERYEDNAEV